MPHPANFGAIALQLALAAAAVGLELATGASWVGRGSSSSPVARALSGAAAVRGGSTSAAKPKRRRKKQAFAEDPKDAINLAILKAKVSANTVIVDEALNEVGVCYGWRPCLGNVPLFCRMGTMRRSFPHTARPILFAARFVCRPLAQNDPSAVHLSPAKMEELEIFHGDTVLLRGKKRKSTLACAYR